MYHNDKARTIVYIDVEEFHPASRRLLPSLLSPMDAFDGGPGPSFRLAPSSPVYSPSSPKIASTSPNRPFASLEWVPRSTSPENWGPTSPGPVPLSPPYIPRSPESVPRTTSPVNYYPTSPGPVPPSPPYIPGSPEWALGETSPANYYPTSPGPVPPSPPYIPRSPEWLSTSPPPATLGPTSPPPVPQSPAYTPTSPQSVSRGTSPTNYYPTSPGPVPPSPPYVPLSPEWASTSSPPVPLSPSSPTTTDPFDQLERDLDGYRGRSRFVYNRARSIVPAEEGEQRQRGERETSTEPFPKLPDWEEENTERETEGDVQDVMVHEPAAAVPEEEELPDYEYYEQIKQENGDTERNVEEDVQMQEPVFAVPEESEDNSQPSNPSTFTYGHPATPFPWIRSNPFVSTPSASASSREPAFEPEDLPDHEYYAQLDQETVAETLIRLETEHMSSVVDSPYTAIAALNCEPAQSNSCPSYPSFEIDMHHNDAKEEHVDWLSSSSSFRSSSVINNSVYRVPPKPMGRVKVQKRIDRMMWNRLMQRKMVHMMNTCEKYVPADVLKGLKR